MVTISARRQRKPRGSFNAPTPERLAKADMPVRMADKGVRDPIDQLRSTGDLHEEHCRAGLWFRRLTEAALTGRGENDHFRADRRRGYRASTPMPTAVASRMELETIRDHIGERDFRLLADAVMGRPAKDVERLRYVLEQIDRREWRPSLFRERKPGEAA